MLGFYYALILLVWIILVLILKWRKNRAKLEQQMLQQQNARPQIHVIQIGSSLYDVIPISPNHQDYRCDCTEYNLNMDRDRDHQHHHTNVGFILDDDTTAADGGIFPDQHNLPQHNNITANYLQNDRAIGTTPPPSYDDVMRNAIDRNNRSSANNDNLERIATTGSDENLPKYVINSYNSGSDVNNRNRYNISHSIDHNSI